MVRRRGGRLGGAAQDLSCAGIRRGDGPSKIEILAPPPITPPILALLAGRGAGDTFVSGNISTNAMVAGEISKSGPLAVRESSSSSFAVSVALR